MSEQRRRDVLALCREHEVLVVEDLTTADLVFDGATPTHLSALDAEHVITIGSFSKVLWGGLRVGWIRAAPAMVLRLGRLKAAYDLGTGTLDQAACLAALDRWDELVAARRAMAQERYAAFSAALADALPGWRHEPVKGGFSMWVRLPGGSSEDFAAAAMRRGVAISTGASAAPEELFLDHVRLCFTAPPELLAEAVVRLRAAWDERTHAPELALAR
jgi:DNA-binding transcriptional MocR family regulator